MVENIYGASNCIQKFFNKNKSLKIQGYEPTVIRDESGKVIDFRNDNSVDAHKPIEHFMIYDNLTSSKFLYELNVNNIARIHESPDDKKFNNLVSDLMTIGIDVDGEPDVKTYYKMLNIIGEQTAGIVKMGNGLVVRSMKRACYDPKQNVGHFALTLNNYTHFTSPIWRYPDLIEHRIMKKVLKIFNDTIER